MQYSLVFIKGSASGTRLACFPIAKQGNGVNLPRRGRRATKWRLGLISNERSEVVWFSDSTKI